MGNKIHAALMAALVSAAGLTGTIGCGPSSGANLQASSPTADDHQTGGSNTPNSTSGDPATGSAGTSQPSAPAASSSFHPISIAFWDDQNGLMGGRIGSPGSSGTPAKGEIDVTHDGGKTWEKLAETDAPVSAIALEGKKTVWASFSKDGQQGQLMTSADGGMTWSMADAAGKAIAPPLSVPVPASSPAQGQWPQLQSMSFTTPVTGWALCTGQPGAGRQGKALYRTTDGGKSWTSLLQVPIASGGSGGISSSGYPAGIFFLPSGEGFLWEQRGGLYRTTDGGKNWSGLPITHPESFEARSVWFSSDQAGYGLFWNTEKSDTELMKTADAGNNWTLLSSYPNG